jgi:hypothetical protein
MALRRFAGATRLSRRRVSKKERRGIFGNPIELLLTPRGANRAAFVCSPLISHQNFVQQIPQQNVQQVDICRILNSNKLLNQMQESCIVFSIQSASPAPIFS